MPHGNSHKNKNPHHLYEIKDTLENEVYKYGISDDPIDENGLSNRVRKQIVLFNLVANFVRFVGRILIRNIPGRAEAERLEKEYISNYGKAHGKRPRGNQKK
ncbi:MAG: hypothetical protein HUU34_09980 [Saprospiraceae bacterium]|jgi:hypothetical protein|nr:hypothetical protein [Saprospiraceae bacterium]